MKIVLFIMFYATVCGKEIARFGGGKTPVQVIRATLQCNFFDPLQLLRQFCSL